MVPGRALVVTVALLCLAAARAADVIPDTPPSFDDDAPETQYVIVVDTEGDVPAPEPPDGSKRVLMTDKTGRRFTCILPPADGSEAERGQGSRQMLAKHKSLDEEKPPSHYLDALAGLCFYRIEDWWTYEYCYKKHVRQFHKDKDVVESEYSLGTFDADQSDANTVQVLDASGVTEVKYVSNMYTNGEPCDITGQHRETEVRYLCSEDGQDQIASIKEPATCHYLLTLHTPRLCKHPQFHLPEPPLAHIVCIPYDPDPKPAAGVRLEDAMDKAAAADVPVTASESGGHGSMEHNDAASFEASLASGSGHGNAQQPPAGMGKPARHADIDYEALLGQDEVSSPLHLSPGSEGGSGVAEAEDVRRYFEQEASGEAQAADSNADIGSRQPAESSTMHAGDAAADVHDGGGAWDGHGAQHTQQAAEDVPLARPDASSLADDRPQQVIGSDLSDGIDPEQDQDQAVDTKDSDAELQRREMDDHASRHEDL